MWSFLTGLGAAVVLAAGSYLVLEFGAISSIERVDNRSLLIHDEVGSVADLQ